MKNLLLISYQRLQIFAKTHRKDILIIGILLIIATISHGYNMFDYPYYENDEATYISRGWAFASEGRFDPYTYRYDHAPFGWMTIGAWQLLTGGTWMFGDFLTSGRVLMLLVHLASVILLYVIGLRLSQGNKFVAVMAVLLFALSPLGTFYQRRVLLDNLMTMWLLVALYFVTGKQRLSFYLLSGLFFGLAVLTKLNAIFLLPMYIAAIYFHARRPMRSFGTTFWVTAAGLVIVYFPLLAMLRGELLPAPLGTDGLTTRVSLIDTMQVQLGRGGFAWPWQESSSFYQGLQVWLQKDVFLLPVGAAATLGLLVVGIAKKQYRLLLIPVIGTICMLLFLTRGKLVLDLYIVPLIPFVALSIGLLFGPLLQWISSVNRLTRALTIVIITIYGFNYAIHTGTRVYAQNETKNQLQAIEWVKGNIPKDAHIISDNYAYPELNDQNGFNNLYYVFPTEYDPTIRARFGDDWRNIDYLIVTHEVLRQVKEGSLPMVKEVLDHSTRIADFTEGTTSYIDPDQYLSTNGDWAQIYKTKNEAEIILQDQLQYMQKNFLESYGQIRDPENQGITTSASQTRMMMSLLRANDEKTFDGVWQWTKDHLQHRSEDRLLSWRWEGDSETGELADSNTVTTADITAARALLLAGKQWDNPTYTQEAQQILDSLLSETTATVNGLEVLTASADGDIDARLFNPSYFDPAAYRLFAENHDAVAWQNLLNDGYTWINQLQSRNNGLVPNWVQQDSADSQTSARAIFGQQSDNLGSDAWLTILKMYDDYATNDSQRAQQVLQRFGDFFQEAQARDGYIAIEYLPSGAAATDDSRTITTLLGATAIKIAGHQQTAQKYAVNSWMNYNYLEGSWGNAQSLYEQIGMWEYTYLTNERGTFTPDIIVTGKDTYEVVTQ